MTTQTPATAEIEKWLWIRVRLFPNFWLRVWKKTQNPARVNSGIPDPIPPLDWNNGAQKEVVSRCYLNRDFQYH